MIGREAIYVMLGAYKRGSGLFAPLRATGARAITEDVIRWISDVVDPDSHIHSLLKHIDYSREETKYAAVDVTNPVNDMAAIQYFIETEPSLLWQAAHVVTVSGLVHQRVTPYELALAAGNPDVAELIANFLSQTPEGRVQKAKSDERYLPHIQKVLSEIPYDINELVDIIVAASDEEIKAMLTMTPEQMSALIDDSLSPDTDLCRALTRYWQETKPGSIIIGMHYCYRQLSHVYDVYDTRFSDMAKNAGTNRANYDRNRLYGIYVIGWEQGKLPSLERFGLARHQFRNPEKTYRYKSDAGSVPDFSSEPRCQRGLGVSHYINQGQEQNNVLYLRKQMIYGIFRINLPYHYLPSNNQWLDDYEVSCYNKVQRLKQLCQPDWVPAKRSRAELTDHVAGMRCGR